MKAITRTSSGAPEPVLQLFYMQAVHKLVDPRAPLLVPVSATQQKRVVVIIHKQAMDKGNNCSSSTKLLKGDVGQDIVTFTAIWYQDFIPGCMYKNKRPELHRWTWYSNAGGVAKEIDHILVSTRWRILQNCRVYRSAEFFGTDHRLVVATLKLHVKSRRISRGNHTVFHLEKLKDLTCAHEYAVAVSNRFDVLGALGDPVELWDTFKRETLQAAKECIGERPRSRRGFVSTETLEKIEESRAARLAGNRDQHRALSRRTRTLLRRDKERYVRSLAEDVEGHLNANDLRPAYRALKKLRSKSPSRASAIRTADGRLVSDMDGQMARWAEYFGQLFTVDPPTEQLHTTGLQAVDADPPIDETAPSLDEVREAVAKLKGGKAAGVCNISAELLKAGVIFAESLEVLVMALEALHEEAKPLGLGLLAQDQGPGTVQDADNLCSSKWYDSVHGGCGDGAAAGPPAPQTATTFKHSAEPATGVDGTTTRHTPAIQHPAGVHSMPLSRDGRIVRPIRKQNRASERRGVWQSPIVLLLRRQIEDLYGVGDHDKLNDPTLWLTRRLMDVNTRLVLAISSSSPRTHNNGPGKDPKQGGVFHFLLNHLLQHLQSSNLAQDYTRVHQIRKDHWDTKTLKMRSMATEMYRPQAFPQPSRQAEITINVEFFAATSRDLIRVT
ncbi:hypothetical protein GWK47_009246 [Chionoecetes opilio]|uniref:Uncharacterized protein n=1 Tax=Chionoecetes opilio TaxID=41210 RepID=A0A8J4Y363_CHIOP|nr:hypothetical protein GWK47_009246 [Chionoecetes opilio]